MHWNSPQDYQTTHITMARCSFELKGCGFSHLPMNPPFGITVSIPRPPAYEMTVRKMMLTDTLCGLKRKIVARAEPNADSPRPGVDVSVHDHVCLRCRDDPPRKNTLNVHGFKVGSSSTWRALRATVSMLALTDSVSADSTSLVCRDGSFFSDHASPVEEL